MKKTYIYPTNKVYTIALHEMLAYSPLTHGTEEGTHTGLETEPDSQDEGDGNDLARQGSTNIWDNVW